ncbi:MAG TPA: hypothetical protein VK978_03930 [Candidatus Saccharimonadales bacterium]|nr:hypothetical protein [Candidatus Saccharimonadales bacterium]
MAIFLATYGMTRFLGNNSRSRADFTTVVAAAERLAVPADAKPYPERDEERRDSTCIDAACPFVRRAFVVPVPKGQETDYARNIVTAGGYEITRTTDRDCDPERLACFVRGRTAEIEAAALVLPLGSVPQPSETIPDSHRWRLLYVDVHAR